MNKGKKDKKRGKRGKEYREVREVSWPRVEGIVPESCGFDESVLVPSIMK